MKFKKSELRKSESYKLTHDFLMRKSPKYWLVEFDPEEFWMAGIDVGLYDHLDDPEPTDFELAAYELAGIDWAKGK